MTLEWKGAKGLDVAKARGLQMAADTLKDDAISLSPNESGALDASARTAVEGNQAAAGFDTEYAVIQERAKTYKHDNGESGFLEAALTALPFDQILGEQLKRAIGG